MRDPQLAWSLNLSSDSLKVLDQYLDPIFGSLIAPGLSIDEIIDRNLIEEVTAYMGEVIVRNNFGFWTENSSHDCAGPTVVYGITDDTSEEELRYIGIDIYSKVLTLFIEAGSFYQWYLADIA